MKAEVLIQKQRKQNLQMQKQECKRWIEIWVKRFRLLWIISRKRSESEGENNVRKDVNEEREHDTGDSFREENENDPLTWLLNNDGKYNKVDVQI